MSWRVSPSTPTPSLCLPSEMTQPRALPQRAPHFPKRALLCRALLPSQVRKVKGACLRPTPRTCRSPRWHASHSCGDHSCGRPDGRLPPSSPRAAVQKLCTLTRSLPWRWRVCPTHGQGPLTGGLLFAKEEAGFSGKTCSQTALVFCFFGAPPPEPPPHPALSCPGLALAGPGVLAITQAI